MESWFILIPVTLTSAGAYVLARTCLALPGRTLGRAILRMVECLGLAAAFFLLNTLVGMALLLGLRATTPWFVPVYVVSDVVLLPLSLVQALVVWWWRAES